MEKNEKHWALGALATCGFKGGQGSRTQLDRAGEVTRVRPLLDSCHYPTASSLEVQAAFLE